MKRSTGNSPSNSMIRQTAEVLGKNRQSVWFRLPWKHEKVHIILTMPRETLPRGMASATLVEVEWDPTSVESDSEDTAEFSGYRAQLEVIRAIEDESGEDSSRS